eukprot:TRINITY_DN10563_c0_g1_i1.p1 TRINITY_DN10563_c0_g1~~TRINITY_DN10563_c0_g1_i1.p1  ORF type:complete len:184 (+),score=33.88 TRINITY_DN10563_c0_g1_i1:73-624(+)
MRSVFVLCLVFAATVFCQCPDNVDPQENTLLLEDDVCDWYASSTCCLGETFTQMKTLIDMIKASNISDLCKDYAILRSCKTCSPSPLLDTCKRFCNRGKVLCTPGELCELVKINQLSGYKTFENYELCIDHYPFDQAEQDQDRTSDEIIDYCTFQPVETCFNAGGIEKPLFIAVVFALLLVLV